MGTREESGLTTADKFESWVKPLLVPATRYAYSILMSREDAEDAVQEAAIKAFVSLGRFDPTRSFKGWWFTIIRNCCLDGTRKRKLGSGVDLTHGETAFHVTTDPRPQIARKDALVQSLCRLNSDHQEIIRLRYFGDCSYQEIADSLGIPIGTVMSRIHAARLALAKEYKEVEK
ncbi:MAG: RNA polymerase sigma factor [Candidatus Omnitrophica bacterium]|nr:RNA polymerase sigma factor [Candidatus Omnitrophota bacterium]